MPTCRIKHEVLAGTMKEMRDLTKLIQVTSIQTITHPAIWLLLIAILILFHQYVRYRLTYLFNKSYLSQVRRLTLELPWYNPIDYYYVELTKENTFGDNPDERNYLKTLRVKCIPSVCWVMALKVLCCRMNSFVYTELKFSQFLLRSSIYSLL